MCFGQCDNCFDMPEVWKEEAKASIGLFDHHIRSIAAGDCAATVLAINCWGALFVW